jgi:hypothetical protein
MPACTHARGHVAHHVQRRRPRPRRVRHQVGRRARLRGVEVQARRDGGRDQPRRHAHVRQPHDHPLLRLRARLAADQVARGARRLGRVARRHHAAERRTASASASRSSTAARSRRARRPTSTRPGPMPRCSRSSSRSTGWHERRPRHPRRGGGRGARRSDAAPGSVLAQLRARRRRAAASARRSSSPSAARSASTCSPLRRARVDELERYAHLGRAGRPTSLAIDMMVATCRTLSGATITATSPTSPSASTPACGSSGWPLPRARRARRPHRRARSS